MVNPFSYVSDLIFGKSAPEVEKIDPRLTQYKDDSYAMFEKAQNRGDEMANSLSDFAKKQMNMTPKEYLEIYNQMANNPMLQTDINRGQTQNYNQMAMGGMANSNLNSYENERIRQMISNQYAQQNFSNWMGIQNSGIGIADKLTAYGLTAGQSTVTGVQNDENLLLGRNQLNLDRAKFEAKEMRDSLLSKAAENFLGASSGNAAGGGGNGGQAAQAAQMAAAAG